MIDIALISAPPGATNRIFGRPLLERLMITCERAGISRFVIESAPDQHIGLGSAMGRFADRPGVSVVSSFGELVDQPAGVPSDRPCLMVAGNLVFSASQLNRLLAEHAKAPVEVVKLRSVGGAEEGAIAAGPLSAILAGRNGRSADGWARAELPFALDGRAEDRNQAEVRLARSLRHETVATDGFLARHIDRRISWRLSYRLARLGVTPNQITILNTLLGFGCAVMFASVSYWWRLAGALLFLLSVTLDGVDGEVARLRMAETRAGDVLDKVTDNLVNVAVFAGLMIGAYRVSGSVAYFYLLALLLGGFALCAVAVQRALRMRGPEAERWLSKVERLTGRDFAYLLLLLAIFDRLTLFCWGTAFGTYVVALTLWWLTDRRTEANKDDSRLRHSGAAAEEV